MRIVIAIVMLSFGLANAASGVEGETVAGYKKLVSEGAIRAWIVQTATGQTCGALLLSDGGVVGLEKCPITMSLSRVRRWARADQAITLSDEEGRELLLFRPMAENFYRAYDGHDAIDLRLLVPLPAR